MLTLELRSSQRNVLLDRCSVTESRAPAATAQRVQKMLARSGVGSRRQVEQWIREGRIQIDGQPASLGQRVDRDSRVELDGRVIALQVVSPRRLLVYHKPEGELCTRRDPDGRRTVFDTLSDLDGERLLCVGRLDFNTSGILLMTTDGDLANLLMHPSSQIEREYRCRVHGQISRRDLARLKSGICLDDGLARFEQVTAQSDGQKSSTNRWYTVSLRRGRYREVRRLWEAVGGRVSRLIRTRYGCVRLDRNLKPGDFRELDESVIDHLTNTQKPVMK